MYDKNCAGYWHWWLETNKVIPHQESVTGKTWSWEVEGEKKYFFVDETSDFHGPYDSYNLTVEAMKAYADTL